MSLFFAMSRNETENTISDLTDNDEQQNVHKCKHSAFSKNQNDLR
jgi:hypothetical protein